MGRQGIIANFAAGLIILYEGPIRLKDVVTIGDGSGQVTQIRMRATTLTDSINRLEIPVGIAYGSDTQKAKAILENCGRGVSEVLEDPPPKAGFLSFGASSLDFQLRVFLQGVEDLIRVRSQLHFAIDKAFRESGIEIAFPQSDVHIRSMPVAATFSSSLKQ